MHHLPQPSAKINRAKLREGIGWHDQPIRTPRRTRRDQSDFLTGYHVDSQLSVSPMWREVQHG